MAPPTADVELRVARIPTTGGGACVDDDDCNAGWQAGWCCGGTCRCGGDFSPLSGWDLGWRGAHCNFRLQCAASMWDSWNASLCNASFEQPYDDDAPFEDYWVRCSCAAPPGEAEVADVAVHLEWYEYARPLSDGVIESSDNIYNAEEQEAAFRWLHRRFIVDGMLAMAVPLLLPLVLLGVVAFANDHAYVYFGQPPPWVLVGGQHHGRTASWGRRFVYLLRLRHTVLNLFHVVPHLTAYTRLQLLSVLWVALELHLHHRRHLPLAPAVLHLPGRDDRRRLVGGGDRLLSDPSVPVAPRQRERRRRPAHLRRRAAPAAQREAGDAAWRRPEAEGAAGGDGRGLEQAAEQL